MINRRTDDFNWAMKYRPLTYDKLILPDRILNIINHVITTKDIPNMLMSGSAGVGKTTSALIIATALNASILQLNGSRDNGIDTIRQEVAGFASTMSLSGNKKIVFIDEADRLTANAQDAMKAFIEEYSQNCRFIFAVNHINRLIPELKSRFEIIDFSFSPEETAMMKMKYTERVWEIFKQEQITCTDARIPTMVVDRFFPDMRKVLTVLQQTALSTKNVLDYKVVDDFVAGALVIDTYIRLYQSKDYKKIANYFNSITIDPHDFYSMLFDRVFDIVEDADIPNMVYLLNEYSYKSEFIVRKQINMLAFVRDMMCNFKIRLKG